MDTTPPEFLSLLHRTNFIGHCATDVIDPAVLFDRYNWYGPFTFALAFLVSTWPSLLMIPLIRPRFSLTSLTNSDNIIPIAHPHHVCVVIEAGSSHWAAAHCPSRFRRHQVRHFPMFPNEQFIS